MPAQRELVTYYPDDYANLQVESSFLMKTLMEIYFSSVHAFLRKQIPRKARILDVGSSSGHFMEYVETIESGWELIGVDMSIHAVEEGRKKGREIIHSSFEELDIPDQTFDLIIVKHIIEHVVDPKQFLLKANRLLKKNGKLYLETPNTSCLDFKIFKKYWGGIHFPRHTYMFSDKNIDELLKTTMFGNTKITSTMNLFGWALSIQNYIVDKYKLPLKNGRIKIYPFLMISFLPVLLIQKLFAQPAGMRVITERIC